MEAGDEATRILIMDDEPLLRSILFEGLVMSGYEVISTASKDGALHALGSSIGRSVKLITTDYSSRGASFLEFLEQLQQAAPGIPVLVISGLDIVEQLENLPVAMTLGFLQKPFSYLDLVDKIEKMLDKNNEGLNTRSREI